VLQTVQQPQGQPHAGGILDEAGPATAAVQFAYQPAFDAAIGQERRAVAEVFVLLRVRAGLGACAGDRRGGDLVEARPCLVIWCRGSVTEGASVAISFRFYHRLVNLDLAKCACRFANYLA